MSKYYYFEKYSVEVVNFKTTSGIGTGFSGIPQYPNGNLLGIIAGHEPMFMRHFRKLTFEEEIEVIKNLLRSSKSYERYPLIDECGQVAIYKDKSYVYDTLKNGSFIGHFDTFNNELDEKDEKPIMVLPSEDMLGLIEDYNRWKLNFENSKNEKTQ